jgi:hypothetical protein
MATKIKKQNLSKTAKAIGAIVPSTAPVQTGSGLDSFLSTKPVEGMEIRSLPMLVKPATLPDGAMVTGTFDSICTLPLPDGGFSRAIVLSNGNVKIAVPATAVIARALGLPEIGKDAKLEAAQAACTSPDLGKVIAIQKTGRKLPSKKGQDAWEFIVAVKA